MHALGMVFVLKILVGFSAPSSNFCGLAVGFVSPKRYGLLNSQVSFIGSGKVLSY